ncbi:MULTISPECIES: putative quinol monooxygenase [Chryseobacterium]|uniref:Antibiotic biosynthesis monooxygenase n=1 Tax=Chryseobacterium gambrini TaxID=373672 RepID=A0ABN7CA71_9FLAO|nr:putative quinol monooxygenase [Chryseobacterium sp. EO14]MCQ4138382.1 antibiotic biosynthesis monooxygenase [Chryseobacterium sp. EO14]BEV03231.1 antibiotic biosynthesis monooxygenase [Chryseobacterium gambrini]
MDQKAVYVCAKWQVKEGKLGVVLDLLKQAAEKSSQEEGNLFYKVHQSKSDDHTLVLFEGYQNADAVEFHKNSEHYQKVVAEQIVPLLENREVILMDQLF